jgi:hypothetical protein
MIPTVREGRREEDVASSGISAACPECGNEVALTVPDGEDLTLTHVGFVRVHAAHAVLQHGLDWGAATQTAVRQYPRTYVATAVQQWREQYGRDDDVVPQFAVARSQEDSLAGPATKDCIDQRAAPVACEVGEPIPEPVPWAQVLWLVVIPTGLLAILLLLLE